MVLDELYDTSTVSGNVDGYLPDNPFVGDLTEDASTSDPNTNKILTASPYDTNTIFMIDAPGVLTDDGLGNPVSGHQNDGYGSSPTDLLKIEWSTEHPAWVMYNGLPVSNTEVASVDFTITRTATSTWTR